MIEVKVFNKEGKEVETLSVDEADFGGHVRIPLLKQAIVMYHANKRQGSAKTKGRGDVEGSGRKLFRQKGTGNARVGNSRTGKRVGGGMHFAKTPRDFTQRMPKKQKRLARDSAILAKLQNQQISVIDELSFASPKTRDFAAILGKLGIDRSCLVTLSAFDEAVYKSARNIPKVSVLSVTDLNAGDICNRQKMLFTKEAFLTLVNKEGNEG